jgi:hypothetical protein
MDKKNEEEKGARQGAKNGKSFVPFMQRIQFDKLHSM